MVMTDQTQFTLPAVGDSVEKLMAFVNDGCQRHDLPAEAAADLELAIDEAVNNIIEHSYRGMPPGDITVILRFEARLVHVEIRDQGRGFDPQEIPQPDIHAPLEERRAGGLGWYLIQQLMHEVDYRRAESGNTLTFSRYLES
jgi:serine/threonine-protein kinase RsbW